MTQPTAVAALVVILACAAYLALDARRQRGMRRRASPIRLVVLLDDRIEVDAAALAARYGARWGGWIRMARAPHWSRPDRGRHSYTLADGSHRAYAEVGHRRLPAPLTDAVLKTPGLTDEERAAAETHQGYVRLDYLGGSATPRERAAFLCRALLSLMQMPHAVGYICLSAMAYHPRPWLDRFSAQNLSDGDLFLLLTDTHLVSGGLDRASWIHTHGMEQFDAPDVEVRVADDDSRKMRDVLGNAALYMIRSGPVLKRGHSLQLENEGEVYRVVGAPRMRGHRFGRHGLIGLAPVERSGQRASGRGREGDESRN